MDRRPLPYDAARSVGRRRFPPAASPSFPLLLILLLLLSSPPSAWSTSERAEGVLVEAPVPAIQWGVGYREMPRANSQCFDSYGYVLVGGPCDGRGCECVADREEDPDEESVCDERPTNGIPYVASCPATCGMVTPSTDEIYDSCLFDLTPEFSTYEVRCMVGSGKFARTEDCHDKGPVRIAPAKRLPVGGDPDGYGYKTLPVSGTKCFDDNEIGLLKDKGCDQLNLPENRYSKEWACRLNIEEGKIPYAVSCPETCGLVTPSADKVNDRCENDDGEVGTYELKCLMGIFVKTKACYVSDDYVAPKPVVPGTPKLDLERRDIVFVAPAYPAGAGVGYLELPSTKENGEGSKCFERDLYLIEGGTCDGKTCGCVDDNKANAACRETGTNGIPYAVTCPDICELVTPSTNPCTDLNGLVGTYEVKCAGGQFTRTEKCYGAYACGLSREEYRRALRYSLEKYSEKSDLEKAGSPQRAMEVWLESERTCPAEVGLEIKYAVGVLFHEWGMQYMLNDDGWENRCAWDIAKCGSDGELTVLRVAKMKLVGSIPPEIRILSSLEILDLSSNDLRGNIPPAVGDLTLLSVLNLSKNYLSGEVPAQLWQLRRLKFLALDTNQLQGTLHPAANALQSLTVMSLFDNKFYGTLPELGGLAKIKELHLDQNGFSGGCSEKLCAIYENSRDSNGNYLRYLLVDCNLVDCPCATHCNNNYEVQSYGNQPNDRGSTYQNPCCGGGYTSCCWDSPGGF
mmetsp:Transcript_4557/g.9566  ORF Transcript_4557/g.9566 Transcript_4557/m.9566 type:complete len:742 (-) Transcript_4557:255-2480(-)